MKGYKGFSPGMVCLGKQYEAGKVYEEEQAEICESGMHFCENPFDVWRFYPPTDEKGRLNEFAEVEALDEVKTDDGEKFCTKKLSIGARLKLSEFIQAGVNFILEKTEGKAPATNTGNWSAATNTGNCSAASVEGKESIAIVTGKGSKAKGALGCWIVCTERDDDGNIVCVKAAKVDGETIKADTFYALKDGEFQEVTE